MLQVLCGRIVRNHGIAATQNHHQLENHPQLKNVEISKSWFYIGSANLSPSAWWPPTPLKHSLYNPLFVVADTV